MLGVAAIPALLQFALILFLPESPRWIYRKGRAEEAEAILRWIYSAEEAEREIEELKESLVAEAREQGSSEKKATNMAALLRTTTVHRALVASMGLQVSLVKHAEFASNQTALALSLITSGLNALAGGGGSFWDCTRCLKARSMECGFCTAGNKPLQEKKIQALPQKKIQVDMMT